MALGISQEDPMYPIFYLPKGTITVGCACSKWWFEVHGLVSKKWRLKGPLPKLDLQSMSRCRPQLFSVGNSHSYSELPAGPRLFGLGCRGSAAVSASTSRPHGS